MNIRAPDHVTLPFTGAVFKIAAGTFLITCIPAGILQFAGILSEQQATGLAAGGGVCSFIFSIAAFTILLFTPFDTSKSWREPGDYILAGAYGVGLSFGILVGLGVALG